MSFFKDQSIWPKQATDFIGSWVKWFGYWALIDLLLSFVDQRLGWNYFNSIRTPGSALFYYGWMASWFMLFSSVRSGKIARIIKIVAQRGS